MSQQGIGSLISILQIKNCVFGHELKFANANLFAPK